MPFPKFCLFLKKFLPKLSENFHNHVSQKLKIFHTTMLQKTPKMQKKRQKNLKTAEKNAKKLKNAEKWKNANNLKKCK